MSTDFFRVARITGEDVRAGESVSGATDASTSEETGTAEEEIAEGVSELIALAVFFACLIGAHASLCTAMNFSE